MNWPSRTTRVAIDAQWRDAWQRYVELGAEGFNGIEMLPSTLPRDATARREAFHFLQTAINNQIHDAAQRGPKARRLICGAEHADPDIRWIELEKCIGGRIARAAIGHGHQRFAVKAGALRASFSLRDHTRIQYRIRHGLGKKWSKCAVFDFAQSIVNAAEELNPRIARHWKGSRHVQSGAL